MAIALSTHARVTTVWHENFWWIAPSYFVGAATSALAVTFVSHAGYWIAPITFAPLYLTYRTYNVYLGRMEDKQRHVQQRRQAEDAGLHGRRVTPGCRQCREQGRGDDAQPEHHEQPERPEP